MAAERTAQVTWSGNLLSGTGKITFTSSGAIGEQPVSLGFARRATRTARRAPKT